MSKLTNWGFRGQSDSNWSLKTVFQRKLEDSPFMRVHHPIVLYRREKYILQRFKQHSQLYRGAFPTDDDLVNWLGMIQHYGGPTRLLDFTLSFYIAAFFSMECATGNSAIWAINLDLLSEVIENFGKGFDDINFYDDEEYFEHTRFTNYAISNQLNKDLISFATPENVHERIAIQQGLFIVPLNIGTSFEKNLIATIDEVGEKNKPLDISITLSDKIDFSIFQSWPLIKIILDRDVHDSAMHDLHSMNVTSTTLFPGLDGFSRSFSIFFRSTVDGEFDRTVKSGW